MQSEAKTAWDSENTIVVAVTISRKTMPELAEAFDKAESKGGLARELIALALEARHDKEENNSRD